jgi:hypothetical protein
VAVAEQRRGAVQKRRLGIGAGGDQAAFDMHMRVDQPRREDAVIRIVDRGSLAPPGADRLHGRDAALGDPDLTARNQPLGIGREQPSAANDQVGRGGAASNGGKMARHAMQRRHGKAVHHRALQSLYEARRVASRRPRTEKDYAEIVARALVARAYPLPRPDESRPL